MYLGNPVDGLLPAADDRHGAVGNDAGFSAADRSHQSTVILRVFVLIRRRVVVSVIHLHKEIGAVKTGHARHPGPVGRLLQRSRQIEREVAPGDRLPPVAALRGLGWARHEGKTQQQKSESSDKIILHFHNDHTDI